MSTSAEKTVSSVTAVLVLLLGLIVLTLGPCSAKTESDNSRAEQAQVESETVSLQS